MSTPTTRALVGAAGQAQRQLNLRPADPAARARLDDTRRALAERNIANAIKRILATAPPLTDEAAERLAARLRGADPEALA